MPENNVEAIKRILAGCTEEERRAVFRETRQTAQLHQLEVDFGAPAEVILEAIHRAPELTRRMLRGVIADAAFATMVVPMLSEHGWSDVTPDGNFAFDHALADMLGRITIQVKLQRSEKGKPVVTTGSKYGLAAEMFMVEPQKTRSGQKRTSGDPDSSDGANKTRPYRYGDFDVLAVSLQPSTSDWSRFRYTVARWLLPGKRPHEIATYQPVALSPNEDWTDDFNEVARWFRSGTSKQIANPVELRKGRGG